MTAVADDPVSTRRVPTRRAALVTGASSGIGLAIAAVLAEEGFDLTLIGRREHTLLPVVEQLRGHGVDVLPVTADVSRPEQLADAVGQHRQQFSRLDILVNNAGLGIAAPALELTRKQVDLQIDLNLRAVVHGYQLTSDLLLAAAAEHGSALVVNTSSLAGVHSAVGLAVYSAAKRAVNGFSEAMNLELGPRGVKSVALCPGLVDTKLASGYRGDVPAEQMIRPEDLAEAVRFLLRLSPHCVVPELHFLRPGLVE